MGRRRLLINKGRKRSEASVLCTGDRSQGPFCWLLPPVPLCKRPKGSSSPWPAALLTPTADGAGRTLTLISVTSLEMAKTNLRYYSYSVKHVHDIARSLVFFFIHRCLVFFLFTVASYCHTAEKKNASFFFLRLVYRLIWGRNQEWDQCPSFFIWRGKYFFVFSGL